MAAGVLEDLMTALAPARVRAGGHDLALFGRDASTITAGVASAVCFPESAAEVQACVRVARRHGLPFVARGSGTGLAGGAVPQDGAVVIVTTRMDRVLSVDPDAGVAWVEPGVLNLDLTRLVAPHGLRFAPDPSSQQACTIGGNVANNSGGPHCLSEGVTSAHVLAVEVVLPDGELAVLGGLDPEPGGYDLRGAFVGSEGTFGIATRIAVRLVLLPPSVATLLLDFTTLAAAAETVSAVIAAGVLPGAMEMLAGRMIGAVEAYVGAGFPVDAEALLLVELEGLPAGVATATEIVEQVGGTHGARTVRVAADAVERALWWKGRKSAFGAVARIAPNYYLHDTVVPRRKLVEVLGQIEQIAAEHDLIVCNVFHAGDGNLHPLLVFDARVPGTLDRVHAAGEAIVRASLAAGGVLSGEHGIGLEKRDFMAWQFDADDLAAQARLRSAFDPDRVANPRKVLPRGAGCADLAGLPPDVWI
ncbi:MAG: FAD-binding protein [Acidimicrobiia bacterium]|nr:FAD-binding protein [Acidimicrobiia bacterium]